jgi:hypothetical protein
MGEAWGIIESVCAESEKNLLLLYVPLKRGMEMLREIQGEESHWESKIGEERIKTQNCSI